LIPIRLVSADVLQAYASRTPPQLHRCCMTERLVFPQCYCTTETVQVKRCYMKANLVVHPDKVKQKGGTLEQVVTADIAFDILKVAW